MEVGAGARWIRRAAFFLVVVLVSWLAGYKQFRGLTSENVLAQAVVGRQVASGEGLTTSVRLPQTFEVLTAEGRPPDLSRPWPELHQPPLYPLTIGAALKILPAGMRDRLFHGQYLSLVGFRGDYFLLALNVILLWIASALTFVLGRRLHGEMAGLAAAVALLISAPVWQSVVAADGSALMMILILGVFYCLVRADETETRRRRVWPWAMVVGALVGAMCLCDLAAGMLLLPLVVYVAFAYERGSRAKAQAALIVTFLAVMAPWCWRNIELTGNPFALSGQSLFLKAGDPTAEPETVRTTLSTQTPPLELAKLGNKLATRVQETLSNRLWSGGGMLFTALFVTGLLYRFRTAEANRARWLFVACFAVLVCAHGFIGSGEEERDPAVYAVPLMAIFGAGFFVILVASSERLSAHLGWATVALLLLQGAPLARELAEPARPHFTYPPYYPPFFAGMRSFTADRGDLPWMCDAPAGAAWYSDQLVWARPSSLSAFRRLGAEQPVCALVLTSRTLKKEPLIRGPGLTPPPGEWTSFYAGLGAGRLPGDFPLSQADKVADNLLVLLDPHIAPRRGK